APLEPVGRALLEPEEDVAGEPRLDPMQPAEVELPHQDVRTALDQQPELAELNRLHARRGAGELLEETHLVALQLAEQDGLSVDAEERRDHPRLRIELVRRRALWQPDVQPCRHLGVFPDERRPESRRQRTLL